MSVLDQAETQSGEVAETLEALGWTCTQKTRIVNRDWCRPETYFPRYGGQEYWSCYKISRPK